jgi:hypothetical protein
MSLCSFARVMRRLQHMGMGTVRVMSGRLVMSSCGVAGSFIVMLPSLLEMFSSLHMMAVRQMLGVSWFLCHALAPFLLYFREPAVFASVPAS